MTNGMEEMLALHEIHTHCKEMVGIMTYILTDDSGTVGDFERVSDYQEHLARLSYHAAQVDEGVHAVLASQASSVIARVSQRMAAMKGRG